MYGIGRQCAVRVVTGLCSNCVYSTILSLFPPCSPQCRSLKLYKDYVEMYRAAVECLKRHRQENENFTQFIEVKAESGTITLIHIHVYTIQLSKVCWGTVPLVHCCLFLLYYYLCYLPVLLFYSSICYADCSSHCSCEL